MKLFDKHHILPRSRWWSNNENNIVKLDVRHHKALHMLFNNWTPFEQIERILSIWETALTDEVKYDIRKIIEISDLNYLYNKKVWRENFLIQ